MFTLTLAVFFVSGFAALLYQVAWQRMLVIFSGADVYSATVIVSAYMAGLGLGSFVGGHVADRVRARTSLILFAVAESAIALFGMFSTTLYYDVLYLRLGEVSLPAPAMAALLIVSLLWPTFFMGASLPLLSRAVTTQLERAARAVGTLYGVNTLGAAAGALISTWVLLPSFGLDGSVRIGAVLNAACALALVPIARRFRVHQAASSPTLAPPVAPSSASDDRDGSTGGLLWRWSMIYACSGFLALSLEIVWFRLLGVMTKSNAFTFGSLLALYLAGLGLGSVVGSRIASRVRRPATAFLGIQAAIGMSCSVVLLIVVLAATRLEPLRNHFGNENWLSLGAAFRGVQATLGNFLQGNFEIAPLVPELILVYIVLPGLMVIPATFLMGFSFPVLQRVVHTDLARIGRRVGTLLLANVVGSMVGAMLTGWLLLDLVGTAGTFRLLTVMGGIFGIFALVSSSRRTADLVPLRERAHSTLGMASAGVIAALTALALVLVMPKQTTLWAAVHGTEPEHIFFGEDGSGVSVLKTRQRSYEGQVVVFVNGLAQSTIPYGGIHTALGALPAMIHPNPRDVAVIGLGSGDTAYAVGGRPDTERIMCVEIIRPQLVTLRALHKERPDPGLTGLLTDPRITHVFADGRAQLLRGGQLYDIIEADALRPRSAYAGNLYSEEYFTLLRDRLKPGGIAATWVPTPRVHTAFMNVFPYVLSLPDILIGSKQPIAFDRDVIEARLADPRVRAHYGKAGIDINALLSTYLKSPVLYGPEHPRDAAAETNTDLFPRDEFDTSPVFGQRAGAGAP
jgi:predicted membrane-bound spermidine synthase